MGRDAASSLGWVHRNRQPRERAVPIGALVEAALEGPVLPTAERYADVRRLIAKCTDEEFRAHCSLGGMNGGTLTILVDDPSRVRALRERWQIVLLAMIKEHVPKSRLGGLRFATGRSELAFGAAGRPGPDDTDKPGRSRAKQ